MPRATNIHLLFPLHPINPSNHHNLIPHCSTNPFSSKQVMRKKMIISSVILLLSTTKLLNWYFKNLWMSVRRIDVLNLGLKQLIAMTHDWLRGDLFDSTAKQLIAENYNFFCNALFLLLSIESKTSTIQETRRQWMFLQWKISGGFWYLHWSIDDWSLQQINKCQVILQQGTCWIKGVGTFCLFVYVV